MARSHYEDWVSEENQKKYFRIDQTMGTLDDDMLCKDACSTLFWQAFFSLPHSKTFRIINGGVHFDEEWKTIDFSILDRIYDLVGKIQNNLNVEITTDILTDKAFIILHLTAVLLSAQRKISWGSPEIVDKLIDIGERAFNQLQGVDRYDVTQESNQTEPLNETQEKESFWAVAALFLSEQFKVCKENGDNQKALYLFAIATKVFWQKSKVSDWKGIANSCRILSANDDIPVSLELQPVGVQIVDYTGIAWEPISYWEHAKAIAEYNISGDELHNYLQSEKDGWHAKRLKLDFLEDLFEVMEKESQQALIEAERNWFESRDTGGRIGAAANEMQIVFERELKAIVFDRNVTSINNILMNTETMKQLGIKARDISRLTAWGMATLLREAGNKNSQSCSAITQFITHLPLNSNDVAFLYKDLPDYLEELLKIRNPSVHHGDISENELSNGIRKIRRKALGIGQPGYLTILLNIKKKAKNIQSK